MLINDLQAVRDFALAEAEELLHAPIRAVHLEEAMLSAEIALVAGRLIEAHKPHGLPNLVHVLQASIERERAIREVSHA